MFHLLSFLALRFDFLLCFLLYLQWGLDWRRAHRHIKKTATILLFRQNSKTLSLWICENVLPPPPSLQHLPPPLTQCQPISPPLLTSSHFIHSYSIPISPLLRLNITPCFHVSHILESVQNKQHVTCEPQFFSSGLPVCHQVWPVSANRELVQTPSGQTHGMLLVSIKFHCGLLKLGALS